jgi:methylated-DNA-[protein]-cysteine S-methyltransferase
MAQTYYTHIDSPVGDFLIAGTPDALAFTAFSTGHQQRPPEPDWTNDAGPLDYAIAPFQAYFAGDAADFNIPLAIHGTPFQCAVWDALRTVKYGQTASYGDIARLIDNPDASQAVGAANAANHLPIIIPCHRIIGSDGSLTGFGGGLGTKRRLLELEGASLPSEQMQLF